MAAWTGVPQSFLDKDDDTSKYPDIMDRVPRDTLLRRRFNFQLQDEYSTIFSWRPFGYVLKKRHRAGSLADTGTWASPSV